MKIPKYVSRILQFRIFPQIGIEDANKEPPAAGLSWLIKRLINL